MSFQVQKGGKFTIHKGITSILAGLGWNPSANVGEEFDLDAHAFALIHPNGDPAKARFYSVNDGFPLALTYANSECTKDPSIMPRAFRTQGGEMAHLGDNRTGQGDGDDETIRIALGKLPAEVVEIAFWVTIYDAAKRGQTFDRVNGAYVRVLDGDSQTELCRYALNEKFIGAQAVHVGSIVRGASGWEFVAVGVPVKVDLGAIIDKYIGA